MVSKKTNSTSDKHKGVKSVLNSTRLQIYKHYKIIKMTLTAQTKVGLTFGQIFSIIAVVAVFVMGYANLQMRMNTYEQDLVTLKARMTNNEQSVETIRKENREDHEKMFTKFDQILFNQSKNK